MLHRSAIDAGKRQWSAAGRWLMLLGIALVAPAWGQAVPMAARSQPLCLGFRNDLKIVVIMQELPAGQLVGGQIRRLFPGEAALDFLVQPVKLSITVVDGRNKNRVLYQDTIAVQGDEFYSLRQDPATGEVTLVRIAFPKRTPKSSR